MELEFSRQIFEKYLNTTNIRPVEAHSFQADRRKDGRTDGQTDMTKQTASFRILPSRLKITPST
jgi:hypothetical protein